jgi:hypothetical protein
VRDARGGQDVRPLLPVGARVKRPTVLLSEDDAEVLPHVGGGKPLAFLLGTMRPRLLRLAVQGAQREHLLPFPCPTLKTDTSSPNGKSSTAPGSARHTVP